MSMSEKLTAEDYRILMAALALWENSSSRDAMVGDMATMMFSRTQEQRDKVVKNLETLMPKTKNEVERRRVGQILQRARRAGIKFPNRPARKRG